VKRFELGPFATNCYLLYQEPPADGSPSDQAAPALIVDAGFGAGAMADEAERLGVRVERIVLTHAHADHIGGLDELVERIETFTGRRPDVRLHPIEHSWLTDGELNLSAGFGMPIRCETQADPLEDGEMIELAGVRFDVLHTPGHSPGSVSLHAPNLSLLIAGDTLFHGSIGRYDFPTSDGDVLFQSIRSKLYALADETAVLPGHGPATTIGDEKQSNPFVRPE